MLIRDFTEAYYKRNPNPIAVVTRPGDGQVVVVGDTHGQLQDVLYSDHQAFAVELFNRSFAGRSSPRRGSCHAPRVLENSFTLA